MKRKFEIASLVILIVLGIVILLLTTGGEKQNRTNSLKSSSVQQSLSRGEITIRNVTDRVITFSIRPYNSEEEPERMQSPPMSIHRFTAEFLTNINFKQGDRDVWRLLSPGNPYVFRYDEDDQLEIWQGSHSQQDAVDLAPFVSTPQEVVDRMLELADLTEEDIVYDIGCGDGRIVITASAKYGARAVGVDIVPERIRESRENAKKAGVEDMVEFILEDAIKVDLSEASVVTLYLLPESNELLRPKLERELKRGAYVISHNYSMSSWEEKAREVVTVKDNGENEHTIYVYQR